MKTSMIKIPYEGNEEINVLQLLHIFVDMASIKFNEVPKKYSEFKSGQGIELDVPENNVDLIVKQLENINVRFIIE